MLTHDEGDLGVFQRRHPFLHSGQQFLRRLEPEVAFH